MIIAVDYDGTIADTNHEKVQWIRAHLGKEVAPWDCNRSDCVPLIGVEAYEEMGDFVYEHESTLRAVEVHGALEALRVLGCRADIFVITARPPRRTEFAREWLSNNGVLPIIKGVVSAERLSKAQVCDEIRAQMLIDDDIRHLLAVKAESLSRILLQYGRPEAPQLDPSITFCRSWAEAMAILVPER